MRKPTDKREVMGLEIDGSRLIGVVGRVDRQSGALRVDGMASSAVTATTNGSDGDVDLAGTIGGIRSRLPRAPRNVRLGVSGPDVAMRLIDVPRPRRVADLDAVIAQEAESRLPMPLENSYWTSRFLGSFTDVDSGRRARILIAAARREVIDPACAATRAAGCEVVGVDLSAFAAIRGLPPRTGTWLGAVLGTQVTLFVADGRECLFTRAPGDLTMPVEFGTGTQEWPEGLGKIADRLVREIQKTCHYQATRNGAATVSHVTLTGTCADNAELTQALSSGLDLPVSVEAPLGATQVDPASPCASTIAGGLCVEAIP